MDYRCPNCSEELNYKMLPTKPVGEKKIMGVGVPRAKAGESPLEADKLDFDSLVELMYQDKKVRLKYERKSIKKLLESFDASQLRKLRNAIFARHNYAFKSEDLQTYFTEMFHTYNAKNKKVKLSSKEKENIAFIRDIEKSKN